jgi:hypothetical protein
MQGQARGKRGRSARSTNDDEGTTPHLDRGTPERELCAETTPQGGHRATEQALDITVCGAWGTIDDRRFAHTNKEATHCPELK